MTGLFSRFQTFVPAILAAGVVSTIPLQAEVLGVDPILTGSAPSSGEYTAGPLAGQNPIVTGFTGAWANPGVSATATGLTYTAPNYFAASGGALQHTAANRPYRAMDTPLASAFAGEGTVYWSFLAKFGTAADNSAWGGYAAVEVGTNGANDNGKALAIGIQNSVVPGSFMYQVNNGAKVSLGTASDTNTHLFLVRFNLSAAAAADSVTVWIDPNLNGGLASDPSGGVTVSGLSLFTINNLRFGAGGANSFVDEIRFGTTLGSVIAGPELPSVPTFIAQPSGHTGAVGDPLALVAEVAGSPQPAFQWERSGDGLGGWTAVSGATAQSYQITASPYAANGFYRLTATNANGTTHSNVVEVRLTFPPPRIVAQPKPAGSGPGGDATFTVVASGLGNLSYQWRKNGTDLPGETGASLALTGLTEVDLGAYSVRIVDDAATVEALPATTAISDAALLIFGDIEGYQTGLTYRLYDIQEPMDQLYPLVPGQTPNVDEKRDTIDWSGGVTFSNYTGEFIVEAIADLFVSEAGTHEFRLTSSDGSELWVDDALVVDHDGEHPATSMAGSVALTGGLHPLRVRHFLNAGTPALKLEWRLEGETEFSAVPDSHLLTPSFVTRVVAPGKKSIVRPGDSTRPGNGAPLVSVHPEWEIRTIRPPTFLPKVGAMAVHPDRRLFVATFEPNQNNNSGQPATPNGQIWALTNTEGNDPNAVGVTEVANGLFEPAGMTFVGDTLYVSQRLELTRLLDNNGDGFYETHQRVGGGWASNNYHMFHFGLIERDGFAYSTLSTSIVFSYPGLNGPNPANRGTWVRTNLSTGQVDYLAGGLRTPNGIGFGPDGDIFQTDNQGSWLPASRLNHLREGRFYGHHNNTADGGVPSLHSDRPVTPPAVYLPQNEISNSPTQPLLIPEGHDFAGDMLVGELTLGGINRVSLEKVHGEWQGAVYRFTHGFEAGVNRIEWAPDGSLYVGCTGATGNWSWNGTTRGLQRLSLKPGAGETFEIDRVEATTDGFRIKYTKPVPAATLNDSTNFVVKQWTYSPSQNYGGSKIDEATLPVTACVASADRKSVKLTIPGLKAGYVVHLKSDLVSDIGEAIWSSEAWYTLNAIPGGPHDIQLDSSAVPENEPSGTEVGRLSAEHDVAGESIVFSLPAGRVDNGRFMVTGDRLVTAVPFDYERRSSWKVKVRATDSSGNSSEAELTIQVTDVSGESPPYRILLSNAVLPPGHAASALVGTLMSGDKDLGDLVSSSPHAVTGSAIVHEGFDYAVGSTFAGQTGGAGFGGSWNASGGTSTVAGASLSYTDADGHALVASGNRGVSAPSSRNHRSLTASRGADGTLTYVSFLADPDPNVHFWGIEFWNGAAGDTNRVLQVGNENGFGVRVRNGTNQFFSSSDSSPHFFVLRIDHLAGDDQVSVWIDPPLATEPVAPHLFFSPAETAGSIVFDRIGFSNYVTAAAPALDEFRVGNDWGSVTPHSATFPRFELVTGIGDAGNQLFRIQGDCLLAAGIVPSGLHSVRVRATDSAGNNFEQAVLVWVGSGHQDSNGDGVSDADAVRLGFDPTGADASGAYFGAMGTTATIGLPLESALIDASMIPGNIYWVESSLDLEAWFLEPGTLVAPTSLLEIPAGWEIPIPADPRCFWRVGGGWPHAHGENPMASGLDGLVFVGGNSGGWSFDSDTGILKQSVTDPNSAEWLHFGSNFSDFLLGLDYRVSSNANGGVFLRASETGYPWETGIEIQITNEPRDALHSTGAAYGRIAANPTADASAGVWHRMEVLMVGHRLRVRIDGVTTIDVPDLRAAYPDFVWPVSGLVGLQDSHNPSGTIEYRNVRMLSLAR